MKHQRWENKGYLKFVSELPCSNCHLKDGTVVPHHLKGRFSPLSGGAGIKASDIFVMPLCFECHDRATQMGVLSAEYKPYEALIL